MKNRFGLVTSLLTTLFAFGAFVALAMTLCSLTACAPAGDAAVSPPPPASPMEPSEQVSISLPDPSVRPSEGAVPSLGVPASESVAPPPAQPSAAPSAPALAEVSQTPAQPSISPLNPSFPEIPLDDESKRMPVPDFLDEDQQMLYRQAHSIYSRLFGANVMIAVGMEDKFPDLPNLEERSGIVYTKAVGRYAAWADFDAMIHSLFTDRFWTARNAIQRGERYVNINGALYFLDVSMGGYYRNDNFPDTFQLKSKTDDEIVFTLTGYYSSPWPNEGESVEQRDQRLKDGWDYTLDFNVKLVRTAGGWRFDSFHATAADQEDPETAALLHRLPG